jgi:hypothetical protein
MASVASVENPFTCMGDVLQFGEIALNFGGTHLFESLGSSLFGPVDHVMAGDFARLSNGRDLSPQFGLPNGQSLQDGVGVE